VPPNNSVSIQKQPLRLACKSLPINQSGLSVDYASIQRRKRLKPILLLHWPVQIHDRGSSFELSDELYHHRQVQVWRPFIERYLNWDPLLLLLTPQQGTCPACVERTAAIPPPARGCPLAAWSQLNFSLSCSCCSPHSCCAPMRRLVSSFHYHEGRQNVRTVHLR